MPCEKPFISQIDEECCFDCFTEGRDGYNLPIAIVLHEVDEHIEALNNRMDSCCGDDPDCHTSFHYGVGQNGSIYNWVDPLNTAWAFDPVNTDPSCGLCGWNLGTQEGTSVNPNYYTINIAVSTGVVGFTQRSLNQLSQNNYSEDQYNSLVRLVGWLADTFGIVVNQNNIWRHCDELDDFPGGCCSSCNTYSDFLEDVQECIDYTESLLPGICSAICDSPLLEGNPTFIFGTDPACETCGRYQLGEVMATNFCDVMTAAVVSQGLPAVPGTQLVTLDCLAWNMPTLCQLMNDSNIQDGNPIIDNTVKVLGSDCLFHTVDPLANFDLCVEITAAFVTDGGMAIAGETQLLGLDCNYYTIPDFNDLCTLILAATTEYDPTRNFVMLQRNAAGDQCNAVLVQNTCGNIDFINVGMGLDDDTPAVGRLRPSMPNRTITTSAVLDPTTDGVVYVNATAGSVTLTLSAPQGCEPNMFIVKRIDTATGNTVTIAAGASNIDGSGSIILGTPGPFSPNSGQSVTLYWNGVSWTAH